jgi:hypothetical protein
MELLDIFKRKTKVDKFIEELENSQFPQVATLFRLHLSLSKKIKESFPHLTTNEADNLAMSMWEELIKRFRNGETIAFLRTEKNGEVFLTKFAFDYITNLEQQNEKGNN